MMVACLPSSWTSSTAWWRQVPAVSMATGAKMRVVNIITKPHRSNHGTSPSYLQSCFTRVSDMTSRRRLRSSTSHRLDVMFLYSLKAGVSGFGCHRLERSASPRRICVVTRGFQTTTQDLSVFPFLPRHYHMTRVLLSPFTTSLLSGHLWSLQ